ncbi:hypothetical protein [Streptomyces sp. NPDC060027]|uniref:hypothetical protein n=1 Tax=Streptomyces sp. NPDC060027 TaxID=3347040 RepID=UPI0036820FCD
MPRTAVPSALATVEALVPEDDGSAWSAMREKLALRHNIVRRFLPLLDESDALGAAPAGAAHPEGGALPARALAPEGQDRPLLPPEVDAEFLAGGPARGGRPPGRVRAAGVRRLQTR